MKIFNEPYLTFDNIFNGEIDKESQRLNSVFKQTFYKEEREIFINNKPYRVFFRRKDENTVMYAPVREQIKTGSLFYFCDESYLIIESITNTNLIYNKYLCTKCNDSFKIQFSDCLIDFPCINMNFSDSLNNNKDGITTQSNIEFIIALDENSKRITINKRFLCGYNGMAWKVNDIHYNNGLCYIYAERSPLTDKDDVTNMIADKLDITDIEPPITEVGEITVTPNYTGEYFELMQYDKQIFNIKLDGASEYDFSVTSDNTEDIKFVFDGVDTFSCECINATNEIITITIVENITNKNKEYKIKLLRFI
ncbi:MAG: hypothetical protein R3Y35_07230 [Clostridia bacterium]